MTIITYDIDSRPVNLTKRIVRKNTKDAMAYEIAKTIHILWDDNKSDKEKIHDATKRLVNLCY